MIFAPEGSASGRAHWAAFVAVLCWAALPVLRLETARVPPLLTVAFAFAFAGLCGEAARVFAGAKESPSAAETAAGAAALAGAFVLYFAALDSVSPIAANTVAYSWPFMTVVGGAFLLREKIGARACLGAALGAAGVALAAARGGEWGGWGEWNATIAGCAAAFGSALCWAFYSLFFRRRRPGAFAVARFLLCAAPVAFAASLILERAALPQTAAQWTALAALAAGPLGGAFYLWDRAIKGGDLALLGALACFTPILAAVSLAALGYEKPDAALAAAVCAVAAGALLARPRRH